VKLPRALRALAFLVVALAMVGGPPWDADLDGYSPMGVGPLDCNDRSAAVHPGAIDVPLDGVDQDCDGMDRAVGSSVVLITIDTLRAGNLGIYGYARDTSPNIDALGHEGAVFLHAYSSTSWTIPTLASLLTSRHVTEHQTTRPRSRLPEDLPYLPAILQQRGYKTATFVQSAYPILTMGFARGFDLMERPANSKTPQILAWLREQRAHPFFLWVHYSEPHTPYTPSPPFDKLFVPESWKDNRDIARYWNRNECQEGYDTNKDAARLRMGFYDARVREADEHVGQIMAELKKLGIADRTLVILSADHGEEFFEHRGCDHGQTLYDEVLHIPLLMRHPSLIPPGQRIDTQVRQIDIMPTVLAALEVPIPSGTVGRSLLPLVHGDGPDRALVGGFLSNTEQAVVIREHGMKYVYSPGRSALRQRQKQENEELYDLVADPQERNNLVFSGHPRLEQFRRKAKRWVEAPKPPPAPEMHFDERTTARLRALGYLEPAPKTAEAPKTQDAPKKTETAKPQGAAAVNAPATVQPARAR
jgi:arylsulfatase A-like enzyme